MLANGDVSEVPVGKTKKWIAVPENCERRSTKSFSLSRGIWRGANCASSLALARSASFAFCCASAARAFASATVARDDSASADSRTVSLFNSAILSRAAAVSFLASAIRASASLWTMSASEYPTQPDTKSAVAVIPPATSDMTIAQRNTLSQNDSENPHTPLPLWPLIFFLICLWSSILASIRLLVKRRKRSGTTDGAP